MKKKLNTIHSGQYKVDYKIKLGSKSDTLSYSASCSFLKEPVTLDSFVIKYRYRSNKGWESIFNGINRFVLNADSTAIVINSKNYPRWGTYMKGNANNRLLYEYFFNTKIFDFEADTTLSYELLPPATINNDSCTVLKVSQIDKSDKSSFIKTLYLRNEDLVPIQVVTNYYWEDMHEYSIIQISNLKLNDNGISINYSVDSIPSFYSISSYKEQQRKSILNTGEIMPSWKLTSLTGDSISSAQFETPLTLIDFWYKGCIPCVNAIPQLQKIFDEYRLRGLQVLGLNPYDKNDGDLKKFLTYRNVSYPIVLNAREIANTCKVDTYPTIFLVNQKGKILYSSIGFDSENETKIRKIIEAELK